MNTSFQYFVAATLCLMLAACTDNNEQTQREQELQETAKAMDEVFSNKSENVGDVVRGLNDALTQINGGVETVSPRDLKVLLPVEISGMTRTGYSASKKGFQGLGVSVTTADFEKNAGPGALQLVITDIGGMSGFASLGLEMFSVEIDEENQNGFQRTELYKGHKSFRQHQTANDKTNGRSNSEMLIFVNDRFIVKASGTDIDWDLIEDVVDGIPIDKLEELTK